MNNDFLCIDDFTNKELLELLSGKNSFDNYILEKFTFALIFEKPSTRTRVSFGAGIQKLGGKVLFIDSNMMQTSRGETTEDTARTLEQYVDCIIARVNSDKTLRIMAENTKIPVVNALSDLCHPCQTLADLYTIVNKVNRGKWENLNKIRVAYIGDGNNVCNSLMLGCAKLGININIACPEGYEPDVFHTSVAERYAEKNGSEVNLTENPKEAVKGCDVIYNDTFISMGDEKQRKIKLKAFLPKYQVNDELFKLAPDAFYMHCLPAHRGEEVTTSVIDGSRSIVFEQAHNRMVTQNMLLVKLLGR